MGKVQPIRDRDIPKYSGIAKIVTPKQEIDHILIKREIMEINRALERLKGMPFVRSVRLLLFSRRHDLTNKLKGLANEEE